MQSLKQIQKSLKEETKLAIEFENRKRDYVNSVREIIISKLDFSKETPESILNITNNIEILSIKDSFHIEFHVNKEKYRMILDDNIFQYIEDNETFKLTDLLTFININELLKIESKIKDEYYFYIDTFVNVRVNDDGKQWQTTGDITARNLIIKLDVIDSNHKNVYIEIAMKPDHEFTFELVISDARLEFKIQNVNQAVQKVLDLIKVLENIDEDN